MSILQLPHDKPAAVLIDWHATLVDTHDAMYHAVDDVLPRLKELGLWDRLLKPEESKTIEDAKLVKYVRENNKLHPKITAQRKISRTDIFEVLFGADGDAKRRIHQAFDDCYKKYVDEVHPLESDIRVQLERLRQSGVPVARVELLDTAQMEACIRYSKLDYAAQPTLFFEFHGSPAHVAEQVETVKAIAETNGGGEFAWSNRPEERNKLWRARHDAYYAAVNLREGAIGWATDVCVPMSRLAECIAETHKDLATASMPATILGHVGDGNFHVVFSIDPDAPEEMREVEALNARLVERALAMDGTCTGEHGIGLGKQEWLVAELGDAVDEMRTIKRALDPDNLLNPGKIFSL